MNLSLVILLVFVLSVRSQSNDKCFSVPCVQSAANILERINTKIDPCEDFYSYSCGSFAENVFTPDEKSSVDSLSLMSDKLQEFLLTLLTTPIKADEPKNHKLAKMLYTHCIDYDRVNKRGKEPLIIVLRAIGGYPMIERDWNEESWQWEDAILKLRYYITKKKSNNIFTNQNVTFADISHTKKFFVGDDFTRAISNLKILMRKIAIELGANDNEVLNSDIDDLIEFETNLSNYSKKFKLFRKRKRAKAKSIEEFQQMHKWILWLEILSPSIWSSDADENAVVSSDFNIKFYEFLKTTKKRTLANYVAWRIIQVTIILMGEEFRQIFLNFEQLSFGNEDYEQRWKLCTALISDKAPVAIGSLYISQYFSKADKTAAEQMVDEIIAEYKELIKRSVWMDESTKTSALEKANGMLKFIGYHDYLRRSDADHFYDELTEWNEFFELLLSLILFRTDRDFRRIHAKDLKTDWTKYSKPATVNAFYNSKDNSIQFPAAILQFPFYNKARLDALNFGGIGSIIGHEVTHAFDDLSSKLNTWSVGARNIYNKCLIDQYGSYRVPEIERHFNISEFRLNGLRTIRENIADNGGVKLAYEAFRKRALSNNNNNLSLVGLEALSNEKLFYLSFAQAFCSVERPAKMRSNIESDLHALNKFRVIGVLSNLEEFSRAWNCSAGAAMNPKIKCALW